MLALCLAVGAAAILVRRLGARSNAPAAAAQAVSPAPEVQAPAKPAGLSRKRKGFDDAIAELKSASNQNQRLGAYYNRVIKRTDGQAAEAETATSVQTSMPGAKPEPLAVMPAPTALPPTTSAPPAGLGIADSSVPAIAHDPGAVAPARASQQVGPDRKQETLVPAVPAGRSAGDSTAPGAGNSGLVAGDMKFDLNPAIDQWVRYYTQTRAGRTTMQQGLDRCKAYLDTSRAEFRQSGLPEDLVWVAQVESVWKEGAKSPVAAGGIWQFMPRTASDYGLVVGSPDDERFNPAKETRAAATYLRDLYTLFGSWELALAAYNCGEPRLMNAIVQCGQPDFWALYDRRLLPRETSNYVPKILAAIKVASDPDDYAFSIEARSN
jgi:hypothetical protein